MATGDKLVNLNVLKAVHDHDSSEISDLKSALGEITTATASDVGKALSPKTVTNGEVTEWQYKSISGGGGGGGAVDDVQINGSSILSDGVANIPVLSSSTFGVAKISNSKGTGIDSDGVLYVNRASTSFCKAGTEQYKPITPYNQQDAVFYGLATAAGDTTQKSSSNAVGTYTDTAAALIRAMLGCPDSIEENAAWED